MTTNAPNLSPTVLWPDCARKLLNASLEWWCNPRPDQNTSRRVIELGLNRSHAYAGFIALVANLTDTGECGDDFLTTTVSRSVTPSTPVNGFELGVAGMLIANFISEKTALAFSRDSRTEMDAVSDIIDSILESYGDSRRCLRSNSLKKRIRSIAKLSRSALDLLFRGELTFYWHGATCAYRMAHDQSVARIFAQTPDINWFRKPSPDQ